MMYLKQVAESESCDLVIPDTYDYGAVNIAGTVTVDPGEKRVESLTIHQLFKFTDKGLSFHFY